MSADPAPSGGSVPLLETRGLTLRFPGVRALDEVDWEIRPGEVHVLIGENGAGKSSLVKVISGVHRPSSGTMLWAGAPYDPTAPRDAIEAGIRVVHQELQPLPHLDLAENLTIESPPSRFGLIDRRAMHARARELLDTVGLTVSSTTRAEHLGIAQLQLLEIAKALAARSRLIVLDEPTATLTPTEVASLFAIVRRLCAEGVAVLYISHHLQEIAEIGDRVTVMRNGAIAATLAVPDTTIPQLIGLMVGRDLREDDLAPAPFRAGTELLRVEGLRCRGNPHPVDLTLAEGEILGIAGLMGSGRTETIRALFGADRRDSGRIWVRGIETAIDTPADAVRAGVCLLTEDRKGQGLMLAMSGSVNTSITDLRAVSRRSLLDRAAERAAAEDYRRQLAIRAPSVDVAVGTLSGGNQQKYVLAKWLFRGGAVLLLDEPTRGVDVGAKIEIYAILRALAAEGRGLIVVSSDLPELMLLCHRIAVLSRGRITGEVLREDFDQEAILTLAYQAYASSAGTRDEGAVRR